MVYLIAFKSDCFHHEYWKTIFCSKRLDCHQIKGFNISFFYSQSYRKVGLYWVGSITNSLLVLVPGSVLGKLYIQGKLFSLLYIFWQNCNRRKYVSKSCAHAFLAHLSTTCSRGAFRVVMCLLCIAKNPLNISKLLGQFGPNLAGMFLGRSSFKNVHRIWFHQKLCHGNKMEFLKQFFKNLLWNRWSDFEIISQECSLGDPLKDQTEASEQYLCGEDTKL